MNPWCTIGGVATTVCQPNEFIIPDSAVVGDVLVLTKPLGTQVKFVTLSLGLRETLMSGIQEKFPEEQVRMFATHDEKSIPKKSDWI